MKKILFCFLFLVVSIAVYATNQPLVMVKFNIPPSLYLNAGDIYSFTIEETNFDNNQGVEFTFQSEIDGLAGWFYPSSIINYLGPNSVNLKEVNLVIPNDLCSGIYKVLLRELVSDYSGRNTEGLNILNAVGRKVSIHVTNNGSCSNVNPLPGLYNSSNYVSNFISIKAKVVPDMNLVYHDFDGDRVYEPDEYDVPIDSGFAYFYNSDDVLLSTTDLSVTGGYYDVPSSSIPSNNDFYLIVETDKFDGIDPTIKDKLWEGNLFVDRKGTYNNQQNIYLFEDVNYLGDIIDNIDVRSRNTDQQGIWDDDTITIGPDDKDQVISPIRWNLSVEGTDFPYVDLDHDGRIDPDDKDHIISPLYWDFPN